MLKLALTLETGEHVQIRVIQAEFVVACPYCKIAGRPVPEFRTIDPDKKFCSTSHRYMYWRKVSATQP